MGFKLDPREIGWAPYAMIGGGLLGACSRSRCPRARQATGACPSCTARGPQLLPALDQAGHGLSARGHFAVRVGPARAAGEISVGDGPQPRLRVAWQVGHVHDAADDAALEHGDAIGARLGLREGALPGDVGVGHCHARANFQTGSLVALVSGNGDGPRRTHTGTAAAIPGSS